MLNRLISILLLGITLPAVAQEQPTSQWKMTDSSLFDLVHAGYSIVAVTSDPGSAGSSTEMFFLQKNKSVRKCMEYHNDDANQNGFASMFYCWQLVQPYIDHPKQ